MSTKYSGWKYPEEIFMAKMFWQNMYDENISTGFKRKYVDNIFTVKIFDKKLWRQYLTKVFRWKYFDEIIMAKIFRRRGRRGRRGREGGREGEREVVIVKVCTLKSFWLFLTPPPNYAYLKALLFLSILSKLQ